MYWKNLQDVEGNKLHDFQKLKLQNNGGNILVDLSVIPDGWKLCGELIEVYTLNSYLWNFEMFDRSLGRFMDLNSITKTKSSAPKCSPAEYSFHLWPT